MKSHVKGITNQCMTYAHLIHPRYLPMKIVEVDKAEVMTGIKAKSQFTCSHSRVDERLYCFLAVGRISRCV